MLCTYAPLSLPFVWSCVLTLARAFSLFCRVRSEAFEQRIAELMQSHGVSYFGRLVMRSVPAIAGPAARAAADEAEEGGGTFLTAIRYGSLDDAQRGTALVREHLAYEIDRWFESHEMVVGTASRVLEL